MNSVHSATSNMRLLISFIAFFAIFSRQPMFGRLVNAESDINIIETNGKHPHEHHASLTSDGNFFDTDHYFGQSDVEAVPAINGNMSIGSHSGKLYNYDDYMGGLDMYPDSGYDYGKCW